MGCQPNAIKFSGLLILCAQGWLMKSPAQEPPDSPSAIVSSQPESLLVEARNSIAASDFGGAKRRLEAYLGGNSNSAEARFLLAYSLLRLDDPKASLAEYTRAARLRTPSAEELRHVAEDYALLDDYEDAERWMLKSLQLNEMDADTWYGLGRIQYTRQQFPLALQSFQRALALAPRSVKIEDNLALTYENLNREEDAVAAYREAIKWQEDSSHPSEQPLLNLGIILIRKGNLGEAERLLQQAVSIAPHEPNIREQLGHLYVQQEQYAKAQLEFEQAVVLAPGNASFHFLLGRVYRHEGMKAKADIEFARAADLNGRKPTPTEP